MARRNDAHRSIGKAFKLVSCGHGCESAICTEGGVSSGHIDIIGEMIPKGRDFRFGGSLQVLCDSLLLSSIKICIFLEPRDITASVTFCCICVRQPVGHRAFAELGDVRVAGGSRLGFSRAWRSEPARSKETALLQLDNHISAPISNPSRPTQPPTCSPVAPFPPSPGAPSSRAPWCRPAASPTA